MRKDAVLAGDGRFYVGVKENMEMKKSIFSAQE